MKPSTIFLLGIALVVLPLASSASAQQPDVPPKKDPSLIGTWKGKQTKEGTEVTVTLYVKQGGTFAMVAEVGDYVLASSGSYKNADGVLTLTTYKSLLGPPDSTDTAKITWVNKEKFNWTQGGETVPFERVK